VTQVATPDGRLAEILAVAPAAQDSVDALTVLAGSAMDARPWKSVCYTIHVTGNTVAWTVFGANASDYSDEVVVQAEAPVAANANGAYAVAQAPYGFYRVKIRSNAAGLPGTALLRGICKN